MPCKFTNISMLPCPIIVNLVLSKVLKTDTAQSSLTKLLPHSNPLSNSLSHIKPPSHLKNKTNKKPTLTVSGRVDLLILW